MILNPLLPDYSPESLAALSCEQLVARMVADEDRVPRALVDACVQRGDDMRRVFRLHLQEDPFWFDDVPTGLWWLRSHAVMILGLMADEDAGDLLLGYMRRLDEEGDNDTLDWLSGFWPAFFRNKPLVVMSNLLKFSEDRALTWYIRSAAIDTLIAHAYRTGASQLEEGLAWIARKAADEQEDWDLRALLATTLLNFPRPQYRALIETIVAQDTELMFLSQNDVDLAYQSVEDGLGDPPISAVFDDPWKFYSPEHIQERQQRWLAQDDEPVEADEFWDEPDITSITPAIQHAKKIGRNDACPCGSGKKYKQCCLHKPQSGEIDDLLWQRLQRLMHTLSASLIQVANEHFSPDSVESAWRSFTGGIQVALDIDSLYSSIFMPWYLYDWSPELSRVTLPSGAMQQQTIAELYLQRKAKKLDPLTRRYIEAVALRPFSFYTVIDCEPSRGFVLRDIFNAEEFQVTEPSASSGVIRGDVLFAKVVQIDHLTLFDGLATAPLPSAVRGSLLMLRDELLRIDSVLSPAILKKHSTRLCNYYVDLSESLLQPELG